MRRHEIHWSSKWYRNLSFNMCILDVVDDGLFKWWCRVHGFYQVWGRVSTMVMRSWAQTSNSHHKVFYMGQRNDQFQNTKFLGCDSLESCHWKVFLPLRFTKNPEGKNRSKPIQFDSVRVSQPEGTLNIILYDVNTSGNNPPQCHAKVDTSLILDDGA